MLLFESNAEFQTYAELLWRTARDYQWSCLSYCLMTNHVHLLLRLDDPNLSDGMRWLTTTFARRYNDRRQRYGHVVQGRFASRHVVSERHLFEALRYIALNPVRAGVCSRPTDYAWSAHRALIGHEPARMVSVSETRALFGNRVDDAIRAYEVFVDDRRAAEEFARASEGNRVGQLLDGYELEHLAENTDRDSLILLSHERLGHSFAQVARVLGCDRSTVARRYALLRTKR